MRPDMAKVVTERPRVGHGNRSTKTARRLSSVEIDNEQFALTEDRPDDIFEVGRVHDIGPMRFPVSRLGQCRFRKGAGDCHKSFTDVLNPLRGYLRKQVGRPWAKVWSDLSANLDKRSITGQHIFDHIKREVEQDCWKGISGKVYAHRYGGEITGLYVDPLTHLLCYKQPRPRHSHLKHATRESFHRFGIGTWGSDDYRRFRITDKHTIWEHTDHGWFIHTYIDVPERREPFIDHTGRERFRIIAAHAKRVRSKQASKKEIRDARQMLQREPR